MKIKKNIIMFMIPVLVVALISGIGVTKDFISTSARLNTTKTVILDAGHPELA